jgi:hypothetical protein
MSKIGYNLLIKRDAQVAIAAFTFLARLDCSVLTIRMYTSFNACYAAYRLLSHTGEEVMGSENNNSLQSAISSGIAIGKDLVSLLRDVTLLLLAIFLILYPDKINSILNEAGFKEGNFAGLKWQSSLDNSTQSLKEAEAKISELQKEKNEQAKVLAEAKPLLTDSPLKQRISQLEKSNTAQKESTQLVLNSVAQTIKANTALVEKTQVPFNKSDYLVGLQTLGIPDEERTAINEKLIADGYGLDSITWSYPAGARLSWFASRSTVFYYSASALPAAQELARIMKIITAQNFAVQRGAGLGVDPGRRNVTLFVHFIKE